MIIGTVSENKELEKRISITPEIAKKYISNGFEVMIEKDLASHLGISDKDFLEELWPAIESAINFSLNLQINNGTIPWSIDKYGEIENDFLITGSSSILKSIECGLAISKILKKDKNLKNWIKSYELLSQAIKNPVGKFDFFKDRKRFSMDSYYPILSGCLDQNEIK